MIYNKKLSKQNIINEMEFAPPSVPSTSTMPFVPIPLVGIMNRIVELTNEVSSAHAFVVAQNASIFAPTTNVGPLDKAKGDGGNVNTSSKLCFKNSCLVEKTWMKRLSYKFLCKKIFLP